MKAWNHGHSLIVGALFGVSLAAHAWLFVVAGVVVGFVARDLWGVRKWVARKFAAPAPSNVRSIDGRERW